MTFLPRRSSFSLAPRGSLVLAALVAALPLMGAACASDEERPDEPVHHHEKADSADAAAPGTPTPPAAPPARPATGAVSINQPTRGANTAPTAPAPKGMAAQIHNRVIVKALKGETLDAAALKVLAEEKTGAKVEAVKKGALGMMLIRFVPTDPPRSQAEQDALVAALQDEARFKYVEADRLMLPKKSPSTAAPKR